MIIDFHTHTFPEKISQKVVNNLALKSKTLPFTNGSIPGLIESMKEAGITYSVNLPVMTSPEQSEKLNKKLIEQKEEYFQQGIINFGGIHPDYENYKEMIDELYDSGIKGIKIHPPYQNHSLSDSNYLDIIRYADEKGMIIITHTGIDIGIYDKNYCSCDDVLKIIEAVHPKKFVLAHMGGWGDWKAVEEKLCGQPVYFDTAFSIGAITHLPGHEGECPWTYNLNKEDFVRMCRKHGVDKILFATDCPWAAQKDYVRQIKEMDFTEEELEKILYKNAQELLEL